MSSSGVARVVPRSSIVLYTRGRSLRDSGTMHAESGRAAAPAPVAGSSLQALRAVLFVCVLMIWNVVSSRIAAGLDVRMLQLTLSGLAFTALDLLVYLGLIVAVGCVWLG